MITLNGNKTNNEIVFNLTNKKKLEEFLSLIPEGSLMDVYIELNSDDATLAQLAKVHAMIKTLALHTGTTFKDMKLYVKEQAGLCLIKERNNKSYIIVKSFAECSKDELSLAIQAAIDIGNTVGCNIETY